MPMLDIAKIDRLYGDRWVVLDRSLRVVDHDGDLRTLRGRQALRFCTYFFLPSSGS